MLRLRIAKTAVKARLLINAEDRIFKIFHSVLLQKLRAGGKDIPSVPDQGVEPRAVENLPKLC